MNTARGIFWLILQFFNWALDRSELLNTTQEAVAEH